MTKKQAQKVLDGHAHNFKLVPAKKRRGWVMQCTICSAYIAQPKSRIKRGGV